MEKTSARLKREKILFFAKRSTIYSSFLVFVFGILPYIQDYAAGRIYWGLIYCLYLMGMFYLIGREVDHRLKIYFRTNSSIDRMFYQLEKSGILDQIRGLVLGSFSNIKDTAVPFGKSLEEIVLAHFQYRNIPIAFDFPSGHIDDNRALKFGKNALFTVTEDTNSLDELDD